MFCRQCGSEIPNEAKFCTFCGAKTVAPKGQIDEVSNTSETNESINAQSAAAINQEAETASLPEDSKAETNNNAAEEATDIDETQAAGTEPIQADASDATASSETSNLKAAVAQNKKRSRRRMPMILLVALALALATSVAYAAYRVYTDVWLPYQAEQEMQAKHPLKDADGDTVTSEVSGEPKNALQIADLMMMDPASIPDFLGEQKLDYNESYANGQWSIGQFSYLDNNYPDVFDKRSFTTGSVALYIGSDSSIISPHSLGATTNRKELKAGQKPGGVIISGLPIKSNLDDNQISDFCESANLGKPLEKFTTSASGQYSQNEQEKTRLYTGIASTESNEKVIWYISIEEISGSNNQAIFGCIKLENAYEGIVKPYALYDKEQWEAAGNREKATIAAQSLSQEYWGGFLPYRFNVLTKKVEASDANGTWRDAEQSGQKGIYISPNDGSAIFEKEICGDFSLDTFQSEITDL